MFSRADEPSSDQSSCSSDTGDVLIRSTRVHHRNRRHESGPGPGSVQITVQKLPGPHPAQSLSYRTEQQPKPRQKRGVGAAADRQFAGVRRALEPEEPESTKENRQDPAAESSADTKLSGGANEGPQPGADLLTSRFTAGGRGLVLAALKQRSHSAPHRREVKVHLLSPQVVQDTNSPQDDAGLKISSQDFAETTSTVAQVHTDVGLPCGYHGDTSNTAALAAAVAVAAAAPLIKAQSDVESRVSQLMDGVEKLLQANRTGGARLRVSDEPTLPHLERLHSQQLQLQSQLLESALRIVTGHGPLTSTASRQPADLHVSHQDAGENDVYKPRSSSAPRAASVEKGPVAMATAHRDRWTVQTRCASSVSKAPANQPEEASEVPEEMGPKSATLLMPEDTVKTSPCPPDPVQSRSNQRHPQQVQSRQNDSHQNQPLSRNIKFCQSVFQNSQPQQNPCASQLSQSGRSQSRPDSQRHHSLAQSRKFQNHQSLFQEIQAKRHQLPPDQYQSVSVQRPVVPSMLEEAGQTLRQVQRQKKVLEDNLEALLRAKAGELLHCQLDALAASRDWSEAVCIQKTVDAWIQDFQVSSEAEDLKNPLHCRSSEPVPSQGAAEISAHPVGGSKMSVDREGRAQTAGPKTVAAGLRGSKQVEAELTRLYGRAPHDGLRRTLKKSPYLRLTSPASPLVRKPPPRLVESVRGVKLKSCKTQTGSSPPVGRRHIFSSAHVASSDDAVQLVSMAIPLGRPRVESSSRLHLSEHPEEVTSPASAPPAGGVAVEATAPGQQSHTLSDAGGLTLAPPSAQDEENSFPGTDFLSVADVVQEEELSVGAVELGGGPRPPPVQYQGPLFPPQPPPALPALDTGPVLGLDHQRDALENRLVEWVEQQVMSRMISERFRPTAPDPAQNVSPEHSESEQQSYGSDIDPDVGGDSTHVRQLVNEVLTETVSRMLGQRDRLDTEPDPAEPDPAEPDPAEPPGPAAAQQETVVAPVLTPVPTPPPNPSPCVGGPTPLATPPPSEPASEMTDESPEPITAHGHVATPISSPEPPPSAGTSPASHHELPPVTWGDSELDLVDERPEEHLDPLFRLVSVAEEEPHLSPPHPPPSPPSSAADPGPAPVPSSSEETSSSSSSSRTVTEAAVQHISEGELFVSLAPPAAPSDEPGCSFSSSLHELQDMDLDPPSEGQVRGQDLLLTPLPKMGQQGERPQPEGSWGADEEASVGEVRDNQTSNLSTSAEENQTSTPGRISPCADTTGFSFQDTDQGSLFMGDLMSERLCLTSDLQPELSLSMKNPHTAAQVGFIQVKQKISQTAEPEAAGTRRMDVHLPSTRPDQEVTEESDSSGFEVV